MLWKLASNGRGESGIEGETARVLVQGLYGEPILSPSDKGDSSLTTALAGSLGHTLMPSFSGALLVAGGSGIAFVLTLLSDLVAAHAAGTSALTTVS
jgi:hypothetical protein